MNTNYIPLAPFFEKAPSGNGGWLISSSTPPIVQYHMCILEVHTMKTHLRRNGIALNEEGLRRVSQVSDVVNASTRYILDRGTTAERLLFTSRVTVREMDRAGERKMMYCAAVAEEEPTLAPVPTKQPLLRAGVLDDLLSAQLETLKQELRELGITLRVAVIDEGELWLTMHIRRTYHPPSSVQNLIYQIKERLSITTREVRVHYLPGRCEPAALA